MNPTATHKTGRAPTGVPAETRSLVIGGGTMGADVAVVLLRAGCPTLVVEPTPARRESLSRVIADGLAQFDAGRRIGLLKTAASLDEVDWSEVDLVSECIPEKLALKRDLFGDLERRARGDTLLTSNSSSFPISAIAEGLQTPGRMIGLHFFMPAHLVPLVEVVIGAATDPGLAAELHAFMGRCAMVPVLVRKDLPGFLANRLQHALAREAFALIDAGIASPEDVDAAVRFGFGFRFLAAGPVLQRDHAGLEVHTAAAASMYPSLAANAEPARALTDRVAAGKLGMKTGEGFFSWTPESIAAERQRYDRLLLAGLKLLADELPKLAPDPSSR